MYEFFQLPRSELVVVILVDVQYNSIPSSRKRYFSLSDWRVESPIMRCLAHPAISNSPPLTLRSMRTTSLFKTLSTLSIHRP